MAELRFKGFGQIKLEKFDEVKNNRDILYLVRTDAEGKEGFLYLNGRRYGDLSLLKEALATLSGDVESKIAALEARKEGSISADTYVNAQALAKADNLGQIIYIVNDTEVGEGDDKVVYGAGAYIVTGEGELSKLGTTTATGDLSGDVAALKGKVGTLESNVAALSGYSADFEARIATLEEIEHAFVESGKVENRTIGEGEEAHEELCIVLKLKDQDQELIIPAAELVDVYTEGDYIKIDDHEISVDFDKVKEDLGVDGLSGVVGTNVENIAAVSGRVGAIEEELANLGNKGLFKEDTEIKVGEDKVAEVKKDETLKDVLAGIYSAINQSKNEAKIVEGDYIASETTEEGVKVSVKVSTDEGNLIKAGTDGGLYAAMFYECSDEDDLNASLEGPEA